MCWTVTRQHIHTWNIEEERFGFSILPTRWKAAVGKGSVACCLTGKCYLYTMKPFWDDFLNKWVQLPTLTYSGKVDQMAAAEKTSAQEHPAERHMAYCGRRVIQAIQIPE